MLPPFTPTAGETRERRFGVRRNTWAAPVARSASALVVQSDQNNARLNETITSNTSRPRDPHQHVIF